ncbi:MAG TPA: PEP-CTERM sorting domain-containing protein, partial [Vicinamibacteria bacterium]
GSILRGSTRLRREIVMRSGAILVLLLTVPYANADVIFDFSGICQSGDCDPGSVVTAELHFSDDASLTHRDRLITADDFVSLVVDYFEPIHRVRVTSRWSPTTETTLILPLDVTIDPSGLLRELLLRDELKNRFRVDDFDDGGGWEYRLVKPAPDGTIDVDLTLAGAEGAFGPRRSSVPEPAMTLLVGLALASLAFRLQWSR